MVSLLLFFHLYLLLCSYLESILTVRAFNFFLSLVRNRCFPKLPQDLVADMRTKVSGKKVGK